jgi:hypothetical protein
MPLSSCEALCGHWVPLLIVAALSLTKANACDELAPHERTSYVPACAAAGTAFAIAIATAVEAAH